ncbi:hypothetical protein BC834DRAFT_896174 [Gloeopeniophorella convolvens]|nr:hypothetical protein BC834DRAFT_896174 [Gloeopeniophorella convolvens]
MAGPSCSFSLGVHISPYYPQMLACRQISRRTASLTLSPDPTLNRTWRLSAHSPRLTALTFPVCTQTPLLVGIPECFDGVPYPISSLRFSYNAHFGLQDDWPALASSGQRTRRVSAPSRCGPPRTQRRAHSMQTGPPGNIIPELWMLVLFAVDGIDVLQASSGLCCSDTISIFLKAVSLYVTLHDCESKEPRC